MFGELSLDALPLYSPIAAAGAGFIVLGGLVVVALITWLRAWRYLWSEWLTSVDHKRIGIMYVTLALVMLLRGFVDALMMRVQQATALNTQGYLAPDHFEQIFSSHGTIMIFFMAMPFLIGLMNFVVPLQIGARDVAFPLLNAIGLWLTAAGAALVMVSVVIGTFSTGGCSGYPPYTELGYSPGVGVDYWIMALAISGIGSTVSGINFIVTIYKLRAPGMKLMDMPLFCWTSLCTSLLIIFALPPLTVAVTMLALDRYLGMHFFTADGGGNLMNYANLFWLFGHPEVYILVLPAFGVFSEVIPTFSRKRLFGYTVLVYATMSIAVLSFMVWLHHFFTMGASADVNAFFGVTTMLIAVPTGVKVYDWMLAMFRGRLTFATPMLWSIAFITFVIGGMTGVILAIPPVDFVFHNTLFLIAHFHNMLIPGSLFGFFAGYTFWFPKAFGFPLDEKWGRRAVAFWVSGFYLAFMPLYVLGFLGMPRRTAYYDDPAWQAYLIVAACGALFILCGLASQVIQLVVSIRHRHRTTDFAGDPWDGRSLEWTTSSPPPEYNFAVQPVVHSRDAFTAMKAEGTAYRPPGVYEPIEMPRNSITGLAIGAASFVFGFAVVWHIWWLALLGLVAIIGTIIARSFATTTNKLISSAEIEARERLWLVTVAEEREVVLQ
ncbi:MAG: cytochrome bo3 quinol oxidase subunit 1 apoprotein [Devosia sp.]|uniref:cbb3-type cytochrome c oxidase subunit I n=1 Tax=Devosia sp. TaxID=1871048 RepID=UPI0026064A22|nr:cbb3-type cytochrome c oxidase subunit I [Devosia sp.]MDB5541103.1 cytochrome bo3 quinol oxidase subunit 1 apoprotein [Devosia sp.]